MLFNPQRPKTGDALCKDCFYIAFENEIHCTIQQCNLFKRGDRVAIGASGGKDSTVLAYVMKVLNDRHNYGLKLILLSIDEGITGAIVYDWRTCHVPDNVILYFAHHLLSFV